MVRRRIEAAAIPRITTPDDVANVAAFLASDESSYLTGLAIPIAGGEVMF